LVAWQVGHKAGGLLKSIAQTTFAAAAMALWSARAGTRRIRISEGIRR
jgi:hypothetical protein